MKKQYTPEFKTLVVQEILKEKKTTAQIASQYGVHPRAIEPMEEGCLGDLHRSIGGRVQGTKEQKVQEQKFEQIAKVGKLAAQLEGLKNLVSTRSRTERLSLWSEEPKDRTEDANLTPYS